MHREARADRFLPAARDAHRGGEVSKRRLTGEVLTTISAGAVIGIVEVVLAISFAALVFGGLLRDTLAAGIGIYLVAATATLAILALRGGARGVVGSVQDAAAAVLSIVVATVALDAKGGVNRTFLTVVAATMIVTLLTALTFLLLGTFRLGNLARFIPYPVVGGFLAGTGWLLFMGGIRVAGRTELHLDTLDQFFDGFALIRWGPALLFGVILLIATRLIHKPMVIPIVIGLGLLAFAVALPITGSSIRSAREGLWLLGPFVSPRLSRVWSIRAVSGADWSAVLGNATGIATTVFVAVMGCLFNVGGVELLLRKDLDTNRELRDAGLVNVVTGAFGGIPGYHALSLTSLADQMAADGRVAGLIAALVPLATVLFGASVVALVPRMIVGGVLVFVGLSFLVTWVIDVRRSLPLGEYLIVLAILVTVATRGLIPGLVVGLLLAVALFAVHYGRIEMVHEVPFGTTYRSNVWRPVDDRQRLDEMADRVQVLRLNGFVFFGTASAILQRIRIQSEAGPARFLVIDLRRVTGVDASGTVALKKVAQLTAANGTELVFTGGSDRILGELARGGLIPADGVRFEADLDHGLERCEDGLLAAPEPHVAVDADGLAGCPAAIRPLLERVALDAGDVLIHQGEVPDDVFVLGSGGLRVEVTTADGTRMRVGTVRPGVMVGEIALYTASARTADVIADVPSIAFRLRRSEIERLEAEDPIAAAAVHRWLATTLATRLTDAQRLYSALLD
jgi:sulfate permease, SulP family